MTQIVIETIGLPESKKGGYRAWREDLGKSIEMISGRQVREIRGTVWRIAYQYGFFNDEDKQKILTVLENGRKKPISVAFLPPDSNELKVSSFFVDSLNYPKFMWSRDVEGNPAPMWADLSFELREVKPSD